MTLLLAIFWMTSLIYFKTMPILLYNSSGTVSYSLVLATIATFFAFLFVARTNGSHIIWIAKEKHTRPIIALKPIGDLIAFCAAMYVLIFIVSAGFSEKLHRKLFGYSAEIEELLVLIIFATIPPLSLYLILLVDAVKLKNKADGE